MLTMQIADYLFSVDEYVGDNSTLCYHGKRAENANATCSIMFDVPAEDDAMSFVRKLAEKFGVSQTMCKNGSYTVHFRPQCDVVAAETRNPELTKTPWTLCSPLFIKSINGVRGTGQATVCAIVVVKDVAGLDLLTLQFEGRTSYGKANVRDDSRSNNIKVDSHMASIEGWCSTVFSTCATHCLPLNLARLTKEQKQMTQRGNS